MAHKLEVSMKDEKDYEAESDFRTLKEAMMIRGDKGRFERAMKMAKKEKKAIKSLAELRAIASDMEDGDDTSEEN